MEELQKRTDVNDLEGYYHNDAPNGRRYSVVDLGTTMKSHPMPASIFMGWEAMRIDDATADDDLIRANSWDELKQLLE